MAGHLSSITGNGHQSITQINNDTAANPGFMKNAIALSKSSTSVQVNFTDKNDPHYEGIIKFVGAKNLDPTISGYGENIQVALGRYRDGWFFYKTRNGGEIGLAANDPETAEKKLRYLLNHGGAVSGRVGFSSEISQAKTPASVKRKIVVKTDPVVSEIKLGTKVKIDSKTKLEIHSVREADGSIAYNAAFCWFTDKGKKYIAMQMKDGSFIKVNHNNGMFTVNSVYPSGSVAFSPKIYPQDSTPKVSVKQKGDVKTSSPESSAPVNSTEPKQIAQTNKKPDQKNDKNYRDYPRVNINFPPSKIIPYDKTKVKFMRPFITSSKVINNRRSVVDLYSYGDHYALRCYDGKTRVLSAIIGKATETDLFNELYSKAPEDNQYRTFESNKLPLSKTPKLIPAPITSDTYTREHPMVLGIKKVKISSSMCDGRIVSYDNDDPQHIKKIRAQNKILGRTYEKYGNDTNTACNAILRDPRLKQK